MDLDKITRDINSISGNIAKGSKIAKIDIATLRQLPRTSYVQVNTERHRKKVREIERLSARNIDVGIEEDIQGVGKRIKVMVYFNSGRNAKEELENYETKRDR